MPQRVSICVSWNPVLYFQERLSNVQLCMECVTNEWCCPGMRLSNAKARERIEEQISPFKLWFLCVYALINFSTWHTSGWPASCSGTKRNGNNTNVPVLLIYSRSCSLGCLYVSLSFPLATTDGMSASCVTLLIDSDKTKTGHFCSDSVFPEPTCIWRRPFVHSSEVHSAQW